MHWSCLIWTVQFEYKTSRTGDLLLFLQMEGVFSQESAKIQREYQDLKGDEGTIWLLTGVEPLILSKAEPLALN